MDDSFIKTALIKWLPGGRRKGGSGWETMNCIMCHLNGEPSRDTKRKAGVIFHGSSFTYNCFRCEFKAHWKPGMIISKKLDQLLQSAGCVNVELQQLKLQALKLSRVSEFYEQRDFHIDSQINFNEIKLPPNTKTIREWATETNPPEKFLEAANYLIDRNLTAFDKFYWSPDTNNQMSNRLIIPFYYDDKIVGYTARFINDIVPSDISKYHTNCPNGFLFNNHFIKDKRKTIILVEGPIDALRIDGIAYMGSKLTSKQVRWLNSAEKDIVLVPDKDKSGLKAIECAIANNWHVSFPDWENVGDVDEAVNKYGVIWTVNNIMKKRTNDRTQIKVREKMWL